MLHVFMNQAAGVYARMTLLESTQGWNHKSIHNDRTIGAYMRMDLQGYTRGLRYKNEHKDEVYVNHDVVGLPC
jgi:hypothetical protein